MEPRRDLGLLPIPERRRRYIPALLISGVVALVAGWLLDIGFVRGLGIGILITSGIALLADRMARRRVAR